MKQKLLFIALSLTFLLIVSGFYAEYVIGENNHKGKSGKVFKVKITPLKAKIKTGKKRKFTAHVTGKGKINKTVAWSVDGGDINGTFSKTTGKKAIYKAPDTVPEGGKVKIRATSNADSSKSGTATIIITGSPATTTTTNTDTSTTSTTTSTTTTTLPAVTPGSQVNNTITIQNFSFSPVNIGVSPGTTITVKNSDSAPHSVTSQAMAGDFKKGSADGISFDTGIFTTTDKTISIPSDAVSGTVIPYFCIVHTSGMSTKNGYVTVE